MTAKDPYRFFRIEARELLDTLQRGIVDLAGRDDPDRLRTLLRASHTLKGAAGVVQQAEIARLAHQVEDLLTARRPTDEILPLVDAIAKALSTLGATPAAEAAAPTAESVRLDLAEVDALLRSLADLGARIGALRTRRGAELDALIESIERGAQETLEDARRLRLLPVSTLFTEIARAAHDAAERADRLVDVQTHGGDRRLDAHVLGLVRDALLQMVRNAIAHGIEPIAERASAGKSMEGHITVRVETRGPRAIIACRDDGRGLDLDGLRAAVVAKQLATDEAARALEPAALVRLAMTTGLTTRAEASELAGRGVGLQVVGVALDRLRGSLEVWTERGVGTELALDVPVSMTAAPALLVQAASSVATIPLDAVRHTARIAPTAVVRTAAGDVLEHEGATLRFAALERVLGGDANDATTAVVLEAGGRRAAIGVDRILGITSAVVMPLPPGAMTAPLVVGASLDADGHPRLALDPRLVVEAVSALPSAKAAPTAKATPHILVCDDSLTSRMLEQSILEAAGYDVTTATSGEEALEKARAGRFQLFVVDVDMPGMNGFETVARMRADPALANVPAVLVTSRASAEDRRRGVEAGARAYIVKGEFAQTEFLGTVRRLIG